MTINVCDTIAMARTESKLLSELKQTKPFRHAGEEAILAIRRTADAVVRAFSRLVEPYGITEHQYNVLRILRGSYPKGLPTLEVGERMLEQQPNVTRLVDRLEKKGLARRERCTHDRRIVRCWITEEGLSLLADMDDVVDAKDDQIAGSLSAGEHEQLIDLLERVRHAAREESEPVE